MEWGILVSIPQAVGVVATQISLTIDFLKSFSFNTASGRCCCNVQLRKQIKLKVSGFVSIPQAVGVVATAGLTEPVFMGLKIRFWKTSYRKRSKRVPI